jgi:hypothetical protein
MAGTFLKAPLHALSLRRRLFLLLGARSGRVILFARRFRGGSPLATVFSIRFFSLSRRLLVHRVERGASLERTYPGRKQ